MSDAGDTHGPVPPAISAAHGHNPQAVPALTRSGASRRLCAYLAMLFLGALAGAGGMYLQGGPSQTESRLAEFAPFQSEAWQHGFSTLPSGSVLAVSSDGPVRVNVDVLSSFYDLSGRICRGFRARTSLRAQHLAQGVTCRNTARQWQVVGIIFDTPTKYSITSQSGYVTASSRAESSYQALVDSIASSSSLAPGHERELINTDWTGSATR